VVYRASWADEKIVEGTLADISRKVGEAGITRQALVLVGEVLKARKHGVPEKSKLYDPDFAHGYRN
jgi:precorrin-4/cobalt-precorrin-4 C11-methyltransferase